MVNMVSMVLLVAAEAAVRKKTPVRLIFLQTVLNAFLCYLPVPVLEPGRLLRLGLRLRVQLGPSQCALSMVGLAVARTTTAGRTRSRAFASAFLATLPPLLTVRPRLRRRFAFSDRVGHWGDRVTLSPRHDGSRPVRRSEGDSRGCPPSVLHGWPRGGATELSCARGRCGEAARGLPQRRSLRWARSGWYAQSWSSRMRLTPRVQAIGLHASTPAASRCACMRKDAARWRAS